MKIAIDPGHGGTDPGTSGNGIKEKDWALEFAARLGHHLRALGAETVMTRIIDERPSLSKRARIAVAAHADLFVSIHTNGVLDRTANGAEAFYAPTGNHQGNSKGICEQLLTVLATAGMRNRGVKPDNKSNHKSLTVLRNTCKVMPAVLVEFGFITNTHDSKLMSDKYWREALAEKMAKVIVE